MNLDFTILPNAHGSQNGVSSDKMWIPVEQADNSFKFGILKCPMRKCHRFGVVVVLGGLGGVSIIADDSRVEWTVGVLLWMI